MLCSHWCSYHQSPLNTTRISVFYQLVKRGINKEIFLIIRKPSQRCVCNCICISTPKMQQIGNINVLILPIWLKLHWKPVRNSSSSVSHKKQTNLAQLFNLEKSFSSMSVARPKTLTLPCCWLFDYFPVPRHRHHGGGWPQDQPSHLFCFLLTASLAKFLVNLDMDIWHKIRKWLKATISSQKSQIGLDVPWVLVLKERCVWPRGAR